MGIGALGAFLPTRRITPPGWFRYRHAITATNYRPRMHQGHGAELRIESASLAIELRHNDFCVGISPAILPVWEAASRAICSQSAAGLLPGPYRALCELGKLAREARRSRRKYTGTAVRAFPGELSPDRGGGQGHSDSIHGWADCIDQCFIADKMLEQLPEPSQIGKTKVGGVDLNKARNALDRRSRDRFVAIAWRLHRSRVSQSSSGAQPAE